MNKAGTPQRRSIDRRRQKPERVQEQIVIDREFKHI